MNNENGQIVDFKSIELNILIQFRDFCDANGLSYYLEGGTLLGAVRHKGFIPWDDDIDVIMPRNDYERFIDLFKMNPFDDDLEIITAESGHDFRFPYMKICNKNTKISEDGKELDIGVFIDVFPIDGASNSESRIRRQYLIMDYIKIFETYSWMNDHDIASLPLLKKVRAYICKFIGPSFFKKVLHRIFTRYEFGSTKFVSQIAWSTRLVYNSSKEYMAKEYLEFEGELFSVPSCYDNRLRQMYDNYWELPPEDKRKYKHDIVAYWK